MSSLLPDIQSLEPICDSRLTFSETPLNRKFEQLEDLEKIQVLTNIVRQTMIYNEFPNPDFELEALIGDDYTSSKVLCSYLKDLNLFDDIKLVMITNKRDIDIEDYNECHFCVLVRGFDGNCYLADSTLGIGYGIGEVINLNINTNYGKFVEIDSSLDYAISIIRRDLHDINSNVYNDKQIVNFELAKIIFDTNIFNGLLLKYSQVINNSDYTKLKSLVNQNYRNKVLSIEQINNKNKMHRIKVLRNWQKSLNDLHENYDNYLMQQRLAQYITAEMENKRTISFGNKEILLSHISPRLMWENGYNVVMVKASAFLVEVNSLVIDMMLPKKTNIITSYHCNMGEKNDMALKPMSFFHPHGLKYEKQMNGPNEILLVKENSIELNKRKHMIRNTLTKEIAGQYIEWYDGTMVKWDPILNTNLVHTTEDAAEASIHLLGYYPQYQSFTRFNYPNPVLRKGKKDERRVRI